VWSRIDGAAISCAFRLMAKKNRGTPAAPNEKQADLEPFRRDPTGQRMTGDTGVFFAGSWRKPALVIRACDS
jgi:hypothetical protein